MRKIIDDILRKRNLESNPSLANLNPPDSWPGVTKAADILYNSLISGKNIRLCGDYDADGVTSAVLGMRILNQINDLNKFRCILTCFLPDRVKDGYGLNIKTVEDAHKDGVEVLLTADCGISSHVAVQRAVELGMTVIISDHHLPDDNLPNAHAICDPMLDPDCMEKGINLAGVGQLFILLAAVCQRLLANGYQAPKIQGQLDLVALGSIADVSTMTGQNRILCYYGMDLLARKRRPGIQALKSVGGLPEEGFISSKDIGYSMGPRINAAGRIEHPRIAFDCLIADEKDRSFDLAKRLDNLNSERKRLESEMANEACDQASYLSMRYPGGFVLYKPDWFLGVAGIVASRVSEKFNVPVIICAGEKSCHGSARSIGDLDVHSILEQCSELLSHFGGHQGAAGLSFPLANLDAFREKFSKLCLAQKVCVKDGKPFILASPDLLSEYDAQFPCANITFNEMEEIARLEPCGEGNPSPLFLSEEMVLTDFMQKGILSILTFKTANGRTVSSKVFRLPYTPEECAKDMNKKVVALYSPEISFFRGEITINISIKEMAFVI